MFVYFNLTRKLWSLRATRGDRRGRVIGHAKSVLIIGATCKVSQAGRARVIREKRKNVHAGITAEMCIDRPRFTIVAGDHTPRIRYNPYETEYFQDPQSQENVHNANYVYLDAGRAYYGDTLICAGSTVFISQAEFIVWLNRTGYIGDVVCSDGDAFHSRNGYLQKALKPSYSIGSVLYRGTLHTE